MDIIKTREGSPFFQTHSATIRTWHWITFLLITGSIITAILNSTLLNPRSNAAGVQNQLQTQGITITDRQAFFVARQFDDKLWDLHKIIGIIVSIMLLLRIIAEFFLPDDEQIRSRFASALKSFRDGSGNRSVYRQYLVIRITYSFFFVLLLFMVLTGLSLAFGRQIEFLDKSHRTIKEIHAAGQWVIYLFVLVHISGVILADLGIAKGVVSGMINGNKN